MDEIEIRHKGLYDFESIYKAVRKWLKDKEYEFNEPKYKDKAGKDGNEVEIKMLGELRVTNFVKFTVKTEAKFFGVREFETEFEGETRKMNKGQFYFLIKGEVEYDYENRFKSDISKYFLNLLIGTILKNYYDVKYVDRFYYELYDLHTLIKTKTHMETASNAY